MRLTTLCMAAALVAGSIGLAQANPVELVTNGDFSNTTLSDPATPTEIGLDSTNATGFTGQDYGQFLDGWQSNYSSSYGSQHGGYSLWYPDANAAKNTPANTRFHPPGTATQELSALVTAPPSGTGAAFVGLDGEPSYEAAISQTINGLTAGQRYTVSFDWASTQEKSRTGATTEYLEVSFGGNSIDTGTNSIPTQGFSGWASESFSFVAGGASQILKFTSFGTPSGFPPMALLSNVSVTEAVPEPSMLGMFGAGVLSLGLLTLVARRRAMHQKMRPATNDVV